METSGSFSRISNRRCMEQNVLAILDASSSRNAKDSYDDRIAFLEAVRSACVVNGTPPTSKLLESVFEILHSGTSLGLILESYRLLNDLEKFFPRISVAKKRELQPREIVELEESWSPFVFNLDSVASERVAADKSKSGSLDSLGFHLLLQSLVEVAKGTSLEALETKSLGKLLLFQYLVNFLEEDFVPCNKLFEETMNWTLLRESLLSMLLSSRKINYKGLVKDCMEIMCGLYDVSAGAGHDLELHNDIAAEVFALLELGSGACIAVEKLLTMIMKLDESRKKADIQGFTTRADGVRTPLVEIILDELTYGRDMIFPFLQRFNDPKWKLAIILQYISKYTSKRLSQTRKSNSSVEDASLRGVLKCFSSITSTRNITKKMGADVVQVLLAHAFRAHLSLNLSEQHDHKEDGSFSLEEISADMISAFEMLRQAYEKMEILPFGKDALFTAATILSTNPQLD